MQYCEVQKAQTIAGERSALRSSHAGRFHSGSSSPRVTCSGIMGLVGHHEAIVLPDIFPLRVAGEDRVGLDERGSRTFAPTRISTTSLCFGRHTDHQPASGTPGC